MAIDWQKKYELGIEKIDRQHFTLVEYINRLETAEKEESGKNLVDTIFQGLVNYTNYHFTFEEIYMKNIKYNDLEAHSLRHKEFIRKIKTFKTEYEKGDRVSLESLTKYLQEWLITHIMVEDRQYTKDKSVAST